MNKWCKHSWSIDNKRYLLSMKNTNTRDEYGKAICQYRFSCNGKLIFSGKDFHCSPMYAPTSFEAMLALMGFLTLHLGDTDREYFDDYTPTQAKFRDSFDCERLQAMISYQEETLHN